MIFERGHDVLWRRLHNGVVVLTSQLDQPEALLGSAADVWDLLDTPTTLDDMVASLLRTHAVREEVVRRDVHTVVEELTRIGAVERR